MMKSDLGGNLMPKLFDEFDLDLRKIHKMNTLGDSGGDSVANCSGGGGPDTGSGLCPIPALTANCTEGCLTDDCLETRVFCDKD